MSVLFELLAVLALVACVRRPTIGRCLLLAVCIFLGRLRRQGWFLLLVAIFLTGHILAHLLLLAWQAVAGMF